MVAATAEPFEMPFRMRFWSKEKIDLVDTQGGRDWKIFDGSLQQIDRADEPLKGYVCVYVYVYVYMYMYMYIYLYIYIHTVLFVYICICISIYLSIYMYMYTVQAVWVWGNAEKVLRETLPRAVIFLQNRFRSQKRCSCHLRATGR